MYVAITRARKRLYLCHAQSRMLHGQTRYNLRSRFFDELPEACLKWLTPPSGGWGAGLGAPAARPSGGAGWNAQPAWGRSGLGGNNQSAYSGAGAVPVQKAVPAHGIRAGQQVFHNKFGEGKVLTVEGAGDDARAQVNFPRHGTKWLALSVAKLTPV